MFWRLAELVAIATQYARLQVVGNNEQHVSYFNFGGDSCFVSVQVLG